MIEVLSFYRSLVRSHRQYNLCKMSPTIDRTTLLHMYNENFPNSDEPLEIALCPVCAPRIMGWKALFEWHRGVVNHVITPEGAFSHRQAIVVYIDTNADGVAKAKADGERQPIRQKRQMNGL